MGKLDDRVAIVTGAGSGIGAATAHRFAAEGAHLVLNDIDSQGLEQVRKSLPANIRSATVVADVSDKATGSLLADAAVKEFGRIDVLVNNVGASGIFSNAEALPFDNWDRIITVTLNSVFYVSQAVGRVMIKQRRGSIVNISSLAGLVAMPGNCSYVAAKHGVVGLTKALAVEWARYGIRVNAVCPGLTETAVVKDLLQREPQFYEARKRRILIGRLAQPEEQANMVLFLASDEASYVNGLIANVDAGTLALNSGYTVPSV